MKSNKLAHRFWIGFGLVVLVMVIGFGIANALIPTWGSTPEELTYVLPGDEIFASPVLDWKHAATIDAPLEQVWPWIAQMGDTRGGYYSYRFIEKAVTAMAGIDASVYYNNTNTIHPEWQEPQIGQGMIMDTMVLRDWQANSYMVAGPKPENSEGGLLWIWALEPISPTQTRLLVHLYIQIPGAEGNKAIETAANLATFMMERKMIDGIKLRAEGGTEADWVQAAEAAIWFTVLGIGLVAARRFIRQEQWKLALGIGLAAVVILFVLVYLQPALWSQFLAVFGLAGALAYDTNTGTIQTRMGTAAAVR